MEKRLVRLGNSGVGRLVAALFLACSVAVAAHDSSDGPIRLAASEQANEVVAIDHLVKHISTVPANSGQLVKLFVRERVRRHPEEKPRKAVLMVHGASVPVLPGMALNVANYDWAESLARSGFDVFMLDFQGSGRSPRPKMDDPCNVSTADQTRALIPNPLPATCPPADPFQLINSQSDWDELDTVVDYIIAQRRVEKVALVSWSQGSFRVGPYAVQHPEKVESLFLLAAIFNPAFRSGAGPDGFDPPIALPGPSTFDQKRGWTNTPMTLRTRSDVMGEWNAEIHCEGQVEDGIQDVIWSTIMDNDGVGRNWGPPPAGSPAGSPPEGVMRVRTPFLWGWNSATARRLRVPVLIIAGEFDTGRGGIQNFSQLYEDIPHDQKLWFKVQCAGHNLPWERQRKVLHHISRQWLKNGAVEGCTRGKFFVDTEGRLSPQDAPDPAAICE